MSYTETDQLVDLLDKKRQCLVQLQDLASRQTILIDACDMTQLLKVLAAKQHLIEAMREIEKRLEPFHSQDPETRQWRTAEDRARCAECAAACRELLSVVMKQEKQGEQTLRERRNNVATQLEEAHAADRARGAYHAQESTQSGILDLTSDA